MSREEWRRSGSPCAFGMGWEPAGEESRDAPLRLRRLRLQPSFGQISPLKRPFGALLGQIGNGDFGVQRASSRSLQASLASPTHSRRREPHAPPTTRRPVALPSRHRLVGPALRHRPNTKSKISNEAEPDCPLLDPWHVARLPNHR
ncbi:hypothetical protein FJ967_22045 [Mesorhizobium sp. B2-3-4]|nr:hypothetical protein FJ967_22045 [Mesorhizobium sp. B2-3-4]